MCIHAVSAMLYYLIITGKTIANLHVHVTTNSLWVIMVVILYVASQLDSSYVHIYLQFVDHMPNSHSYFNSLTAFDLP